MPSNISSTDIPTGFLVCFGFLLAFCITWFTIPSIVNVSRTKNLLSTSNCRTSHTNPTPSLGGIAVFMGVVLSTVIFAGAYFKFELNYIISAMIIIIFIGIKDDILIIDPYKKLGGQIFAVLLIAVFADFRITNLYGLFSVQELPYVVSILITVLVFIVIINGFNLIDGIDGLASGIGILTSSFFGIWFWRTGNYAYAIFSFSFIGALAAFFYFNVFGKKNKIFLGDTGSLIIGFVVAMLAFRFLQLELNVKGFAYIASPPTVVCGILIVPLFDSLRVFVLRIARGKSPFKADRQHIHHLLLQLGCTHLQATIILLLINLLFIVLSYELQEIGIFWLMVVVLGLASLMTSILVSLTKERTQEVIKYYYSLIEIRNGKNKTKKIMEKQNMVNTVSHSHDKVNASLN